MLCKMLIGDENALILIQKARFLGAETGFQAAELVIKHLDNRTRSRKSRLRQALSH